MDIAKLLKIKDHLQAAKQLARSERLEFLDYLIGLAVAETIGEIDRLSGQRNATKPQKTDP